MTDRPALVSPIEKHWLKRILTHSHTAKSLYFTSYVNKALCCLFLLVLVVAFVVHRGNKLTDEELRIQDQRKKELILNKIDEIQQIHALAKQREPMPHLPPFVHY